MPDPLDWGPLDTPPHVRDLLGTLDDDEREEIFEDDDDFDDDDAFLEDDDEFGYPDCGLMPDGNCTKAGSEECDWECGALDAEVDAREKK